MCGSSINRGWEVNRLDLPTGYDYVSSDNDKYGIFINLQRALFLPLPDGKTLEYCFVELDGSDNPPISTLKAWVEMVLLVQDDWFFAFPTRSSAPPARNFGTLKPAIKDTEKRHMRPVEFLIFTSAQHGANCCIVSGRLLQLSDLRVVFKAVDCTIPTQYIL